MTKIQPDSNVLRFSRGVGSSSITKPHRVSFVTIPLKGNITLTESGLKRDGFLLLNDLWANVGDSRVLVLDISKSKGIDSSGIAFLEQFKEGLNKCNKSLVLVIENNDTLYDTIRDSNAFDHFYKTRNEAETIAKKISIELTS